MNKYPHGRRYTRARANVRVTRDRRYIRSLERRYGVKMSNEFAGLEIDVRRILHRESVVEQAFRQTQDEIARRFLYGDPSQTEPPMGIIRA